MMNILKHSVAIVVIMSFVVFATPILAQQGEIMAGRVAGEQAARTNVSGMAWMAIGCVGNVLGVVIAYIYEPSPSALQLMGKSPEYVAAYNDAYKETAKKVQTGKAWIGCITFSVVYVLLYVLAYSAAASTY
jgi:hypothetical protein